VHSKNVVRGLAGSFEKKVKQDCQLPVPCYTSQKLKFWQNSNFVEIITFCQNYQ